MNDQMQGGLRQAENPGWQRPDIGFGKPGIAQVSILFSVVIALFLFIGYRAQHREFYSGILITEFGLILLPPLLFLLLFRYDLRAVLRFRTTKPLNFFLTFFLILFAIPVAGVFNLANLLIVNTIFGRIIVSPIPVATNSKELLINILMVACTAGLCEEFLFRGVIMRGLERLGTAKAILLTAFLFSLTHMDFQKIFGTFTLGVLIGFIVYRTDSLLCGMFAHFTNNAAAVVFSYLSMKLMNAFGRSGMAASGETDLSSLIETFRGFSPQQLMVAVSFYGFLFLFLVTIFVLILAAFLKLNPAERRIQGGWTGGTAANGYPLFQSQALKGKRLIGLVWLLPGILMITGIYYLEVFLFTGASNGLTQLAKRLLGI